ncbi:hypothetical protein K3727_22675 (plasmid) [Rhodobacteraceae bacterium M382]|nr:hypothetical protein K3727_22675 [Rhodobacteraceae bacterium M382]
MNKRSFLAITLTALTMNTSAVFAANSPVTFHFYGAQDCPPCMAFKRDHLADVQAEGRALGFAVEDNVIARTRDVPDVGVYGERDPILRIAAQQLELTYPPIFFVSRDGQVMSVHGPRWQDALKAAQSLSQK